MIFAKDITKCCAYCEHATPVPYRHQVICPKKGIVDAGFGCRKFLYTPLKRSPKPQVLKTGELVKEDFEL